MNVSFRVFSEPSIFAYALVSSLKANIRPYDTQRQLKDLSRSFYYFFLIIIHVLEAIDTCKQPAIDVFLNSHVSFVFAYDFRLIYRQWDEE